MRVLWFSGNPAMYANRNSYNGGGWIASLQQELLKMHPSDIKLAIAFPWEADIKEQEEDCLYYGVKKIHHAFWEYKDKEQKCLKRIKRIVNDFNPDVIQIFGTEEIFGLVTTITQVPTIIHLQGILNACKEAWLPESLSWTKFFLDHPRQIISIKGLHRNMERERRIFAHTRYIFGRTEWDYRVSNLMAPSAQYYYCSEMLRPNIYYSDKIWFKKQRRVKHIVSIISGAVYKGSDIILRTAKLLKKYFPADFIWEVYGVSNLSDAEKYTGIKAVEVNVKTLGVITAQELVNIIINADVFVHPSYIENSPNTVCEAQILGIPVIATNVGGVSSLVHTGIDGITVPSNDVYMMACQIKRILCNDQLSIDLGHHGRQTALERHNPEKIVEVLVHTYGKMIQEAHDR